MFCLNRPHKIRFFKGSLPQILLGSLLNALPQILVKNVTLNCEIDRKNERKER